MSTFMVLNGASVLARAGAACLLLDIPLSSGCFAARSFNLCVSSSGWPWAKRARRASRVTGSPGKSCPLRRYSGISECTIQKGLEAQDRTLWDRFSLSPSTSFDDWLPDLSSAPLSR